LTLTLDGGEWSALCPRERAPGTHWTGGWVGPRASLASIYLTEICNTEHNADFFQ